MPEKIIFTWSTGKDSTLALYKLTGSSEYEVSTLLTTVTESYDRVSMHGVQNGLLDCQAESLSLPLVKVYISKNASNEEYETKMQEALVRFKEQGVTSVAFGDIFLEDLREYREEKLSKLGIKAVFPIWKKNTAQLACTFIDLGFKAVITCVDSKVLDKKFAGRVFDKQFLADLPSSVDPCGENGEFHSFAFDGPIFKRPVRFTMGEVVLRDGRYYFCDLVPSSTHPS